MKSKCIIIEGPQGCGKTNLANYLRENIPASNLYRLSDQKDKTITGKEKSIKMYDALLEYMASLSDADIHLIFDRTFFTEQVYSKLGFKDYDFTDVYENLLKKFGELNYDIYYISLYLEDVSIFETRIKRDHHGYQAISLESSIKQQEEYRKIIDDLKVLKNTKVYQVATDDFEKAYKEIDDILGLERKKW